MTDFSFSLTHTDGMARRGRIDTSRGEINTPAFMPVGTAGKKYSGQFVVRVAPELNKKVSPKALARGESLPEPQRVKIKPFSQERPGRRYFLSKIKRTYQPPSHE